MKQEELFFELVNEKLKSFINHFDISIQALQIFPSNVVEEAFKNLRKYIPLSSANAICDYFEEYLYQPFAKTWTMK